MNVALLLSIVAKRLETLGALTQGDRRAGPSLGTYNYDSDYGKRALMVMYGGILEQDVLPVVPPGCSSDKPDTFQEFIMKAKATLVSVGLIRDTVLGNGKDSGKLSGRIVDSDAHDIGRFLNQLLGLPPENARAEGHFDSGIVDMKANVIGLQGIPKTVHVDQVCGASTVMLTFSMNRRITLESATTLLDEKQNDGLGSASDGFYESKREWLGRRHFLLAFESSASGMFKIVRPAVGEALREMPLAELKASTEEFVEKAHSGCKNEYEVSSKQAQQSHRRLLVVHIETTADKQRTVELFVPNAAVESVLQDLAWVQDLDP